jgi:hypothetical protein
LISIKNKRLHPLHPIPDTLASSLPINVTTPAIIMEFSKIAETITLLVLCSIVVTAAPIPQGVGEACNAILTDGDTGSGMAVKEAGQNAASLLQSAGARRQLDKVGAGTAALVDLADPDLASYQEGLTDTIDGDGTSDSAVVGEQLGGFGSRSWRRRWKPCAIQAPCCRLAWLGHGERCADVQKDKT